MKILENSGQEFEIINYINSPPSPTELQSLADKLGLRARDFVRSKESIFKELDLKAHLDDDRLLFQYMSERPIVVKGKKAVLGRPPENIEKLL